MNAPAPRKVTPFRRRQRRLLLLGIVLPGFAGATALALFAISQTKVYFYGPSGLPPAAELEGRTVRLGGLVAPDSLKPSSGTSVHFTVTDNVASVPVVFDGLLPSLVIEGDGVVVEGQLRADGTFAASEVMARHDENYMAPEVADALKDSGQYEQYIANRRQE